VIDELRWRRALLRHNVNRHLDRLLLWLAARLPHRLIAWVLAHVGAAAIRGDEHPAQLGWMDVVGRWDRGELHGRAALRRDKRRCDCRGTWNQVCDTCQGVTGDERDVDPVTTP
jgi:hypothetical protein